ncbi:IS21-like element helper ATPase IstB [Heliophilum fasciatum]|uniref:DNA replication protein DnaC n=1 Tax=Heliophilum fasciatum TaxID=35700 RepID=A0A4R2R962_9FIRM|nr:IS21-like element helper ATPase IstB [Heliophilum fasciatum]MCW2279525.1 DNA replication protein DnaC [Heliophilum fasciatum]TCP58588.1 DNA replication protein DnaC [Heliophilum fasciatum]
MNTATISHYLKALRLSSAAEALPALFRETQAREFSHLEFLSALLRHEMDQRDENALARRIKQARFPQIKGLDTFDFSHPTTISKSRILTLAQGDYLAEKRHVLFMGNSGTGKTHLAIALGLSACQQGRRVRFYQTTRWVEELLVAREEHRLLKLEKEWMRDDVVILDELGYLPFSKTGAELLFQFCSTRHELGSIIVTTNLDFERWPDVFGDVRMTEALVDRLTHRSEILLMNGESYRFRQTMQMQTAQTKM